MKKSYFLILNSMGASLYVLLLLTSLLTSCSTSHHTIHKANETDNLIMKQGAESAIKKVLMSQQIAWNNADIDLFMEGYWKSDNLRFSGANGVTHGWEQTKNNYKKAYPDVKSMGRLEFEIFNLDIISSDAATLLGQFTLIREKDKPTGLFTLIWKKIDGQWKIISDMTVGLK